MNSTLGSVVPLAMFLFMYIVHVMRTKRDKDASKVSNFKEIIHPRWMDTVHRLLSRSPPDYVQLLSSWWKVLLTVCGLTTIIEI